MEKIGLSWQIILFAKLQADQDLRSLVLNSWKIRELFQLEILWKKKKKKKTFKSRTLQIGDRYKRKRK